MFGECAGPRVATCLRAPTGSPHIEPVVGRAAGALVDEDDVRVWEIQNRADRADDPSVLSGSGGPTSRSWEQLGG